MLLRNVCLRWFQALLRMFLNEARGGAVVPMGSLDDDPGHLPSAHIFVGSKALWFTITDSLPQHQSQIGDNSD